MELKRKKEYATSDAIRNQLQARGIEPEKVRPPMGLQGHRSDKPGGAETVDIWNLLSGLTRDLIDAGVAATATPASISAPAIETTMHMGAYAAELAQSLVPPPPPSHQPPPQQQKRNQNYSYEDPNLVFDPATEHALACWVEAKRKKDYKTSSSDALRDVLQAQGIEPENVNPCGEPAP